MTTQVASLLLCITMLSETLQKWIESEKPWEWWYQKVLTKWWGVVKVKRKMYSMIDRNASRDYFARICNNVAILSDQFGVVIKSTDKLVGSMCHDLSHVLKLYYLILILW